MKVRAICLGTRLSLVLNGSMHAPIFRPIDLYPCLSYLAIFLSVRKTTGYLVFVSVHMTGRFPFAPLAQLDRAPVYETGGFRFEP